jgi:hypothetical protein
MLNHFGVRRLVSNKDRLTQLLSINEMEIRQMSSMTEIMIKTHRPLVESLFEPYRSVIGKDYDGYRNHVYRTITYAMHFLDQSQKHESLVETAFVYHDIGLWTDKALAYLEPSEAVA